MIQLPDSLMTTFLDLCDPRRDSFAVSASDISWETISKLSKLHGVTPFLFCRTRQLGIPIPEKIKKEWLGIYLYSLAQDKRARRQIKELKEILDPAGVPFILLKGASAMLRLYPEPGLRTFIDLDILIPPDTVPQFKKAMIMAGYKPSFVMNSPEDEEVRKFEGHLDPLRKEGAFTIEPHLNILRGMGNRLIATPDIWEEKEEAKADGIIGGHLSREHFILHALVHCVKHLSGGGFIEIKWFIDLLYAANGGRIDWAKIMDISQKWGVEKEILPLMATLNHYWRAGIPIATEVSPLDLQTVALGVKEREKQAYAKFPVDYFRRLFKVKELPDFTSRARYFFHLFFPTQDNLRWRYNLSPKRTVFPYYCLHLFYTLKKFLIGLFHQLSYHPKRTQ